MSTLDRLKRYHETRLKHPEMLAGDLLPWEAIDEIIETLPKLLAVVEAATRVVDVEDTNSVVMAGLMEALDALDP